MIHPGFIQIRLRDLRLNEEFVTCCLSLHGRVLDWGHVRPSGYWSRNGEERPRWPAVMCSVQGQTMLLAPDLVVLVERSRPHWRLSDIQVNRWADFLRAEAVE
jgi:hypothetical protein